ncbi:Spo0E family sporulation regulatory protein-aspartic acid phosphatase [Crassaminicella thermophila]|uniref:Spo0E family sporulation regulatory protein-aspartic acid phosphatase n=1 Tax=Crassaminicella thermophila TaxID=2599308 RepID=A0A5C0SF98_CRATE|nr:Spo0E family sporulation regulatory protein-aspartic acid phosphatase [Crassaminicella thermophila]QEK13123.1 Spo0E family sporulation regulatory protein-aspartic acid phosphatase [Crassaminicella thermophila]
MLQKKNELMDAMNECREKLNRLIIQKEMQVDKELINISEEMDQLILSYYEWIKKNK